jgi:mono/diheme cytochrome c family protein
MKLTAVHVLAVSAALVAVATLTPTSAKNAYRLQAIQQYKLPATTGCVYCHISTSGGANWNNFGKSLDALYVGDAKRDISQALYLILKANKDSDGDTFSDTLEVVAKTNPGDAASKPTKTIAVLEAELKKLGGVDAFKPKK